MNFSVELCKQLYTYNRRTGHFRWRPGPAVQGGGRQAGSIAGANKDGYVILRIGGHLHRAHRVAWVLCYGPIPKGKEIDHRNRKRADNRLSNLRLVTRSVNNHNGKLHTLNTTGYTGVSPEKRRGTWTARIKVNGQLFILGSFHTLEEAVAARRQAERVHLGAYRPNTRS